MSKEITSIKEVLVDQIKDLYSAEKQITKALPKMAKAAGSPDLKKGFLLHLEQTKGHVTRIEEVAKLLGVSPTGKKCAATAGLVEEGAEAIEEDALPEMKDLLLIGAARRVEHYEMAAYTVSCDLARSLGLKDVLKLLSATLSEEEATDEKLAKASPTALSAAAGVQK